MQIGSSNNTEAVKAQYATSKGLDGYFVKRGII